MSIWDLFRGAGESDADIIARAQEIIDRSAGNVNALTPEDKWYFVEIVLARVRTIEEKLVAVGVKGLAQDEKDLVLLSFEARARIIGPQVPKGAAPGNGRT